MQIKLEIDSQTQIFEIEFKYYKAEGDGFESEYIPAHFEFHSLTNKEFGDCSVLLDLFDESTLIEAIEEAEAY